ncbi:glycosyltransferase family 2 protein [Halomonas halodenitrificans]|uniref:glycosyltransferase family 2 protein n=1 Tax=Halomonas halodenitrificans TaxID=28252 RepID=UPI000482EB2F|nr:glycosyltransferase family A protein [Halomonas halodenitrificans]
MNGKWYLVEHEVWLPKKVDPLLHYLAVGWRLGLAPCKRFDNDYYLSAYKDSMKPGEVPLLHYLYKGQANGNEIKEQKINGIANLAVRLWGGHSVSALEALEAIYGDSSATEASRWWAMWHVARWRYFCGEIEQALTLAENMLALVSVNESRKEAVYLAYFCLLNLERNNEARSILESFVSVHPGDSDAHLALANSLGSDARRLELINQAFSIQGFGGIRRKDETKPLSIGNIEGLPVKKISGGKKVSIIMPIYSAAGQIHIAIESLLAQSYKNIEIVAVDDCSPDNTFKILKALEKKDSRVKAVRPPKNGGAYAARNYGLKFATGDLLTTHDSDDWSHPQKIAAQVEYLEEHPEVMGCSAHWIRAQENLAFTQNWRPNGFLTHWSQSSFMFRREVLETIGEWDHVRIGGDTEYIWRMQSQFGKKSFAKIHPEIPLAFALDEESSLTRTKATHVRTVYCGLRHIYREICAWWHASQKHLNVKGAKERRPFPAPRSMFERTDDPLVFDTVIAADFSRLSDCQKAADFIGKQPKKKVALFHWPSFHKAPESLCNLYFELLEQGKVEPVVMGQKVTADHYKITEKELVEYPLDGYPEFSGLKAWGEV